MMILHQLFFCIFLLLVRSGCEAKAEVSMEEEEDVHVEDGEVALEVAWITEEPV
jgi:hypothetical protein